MASTNTRTNSRSGGRDGDGASAADWLREGKIVSCDGLPWGSNYTFLTRVRHQDEDHLAIYKPQRGEMPLWDFAEGTLYRRECAAFILCEELAWGFVPPTIVRGGPLGVGSLQMYVDADPTQNYFTFGEHRRGEMQRIALFDSIANNADRKAGHCLLDGEGHVWAIDHGLTFHTLPKLRTVIWEFAGQPILAALLADLTRLPPRLAAGSALRRRLSRLLSAMEIDALAQRIDMTIAVATFPGPGQGRAIPWPPI